MLKKCLLAAAAAQLLIATTSSAAVHPSCGDVEKIMQSIDAEADKAFTQDNYTYDNPQLSGALDSASAAIGADNLTKAVIQFHATADSYKKVTSELAEVSGILYEWESEFCID